MSLKIYDVRTWLIHFKIDIKYDDVNTACDMCMKDVSRIGKLGCCGKCICSPCVGEWFGKSSFNCPYCRSDVRCVSRYSSDNREPE